MNEIIGLKKLNEGKEEGIEQVINNQIEMEKLPYVIYLNWGDFFSVAKHLLSNKDISIRQSVVQYMIQFVSIHKTYRSLQQVTNIMLQKKKEWNEVRVTFLQQINNLPNEIFTEKKKKEQEQEQVKEQQKEQEKEKETDSQQQQQQSTDQIQMQFKQYKPFFEMMEEYIRQLLDDTTTDEQCVSVLLQFILKMISINAEWSYKQFNLLVNERGMDKMISGLLLNKQSIISLPDELKPEIYKVFFKSILDDLFNQGQEIGKFDSFQVWCDILDIFLWVPELNDELIAKVNETIEKAKLLEKDEKDKKIRRKSNVTTHSKMLTWKNSVQQQQKQKKLLIEKDLQQFKELIGKDSNNNLESRKLTYANNIKDKI
ncbi:MAG: hypothetical protein EZS28_038391 [Streblomastix strix]|uniref:Uncharacterized protein n=1 Tax=Streblomastix strix TaxID=222440 RepID=A0A5J4U7Z4_9EUKA|nr:MAG: hypothetical protein EZS28_038391 [Streblomastix strix]